MSKIRFGVQHEHGYLRVILFTFMLIHILDDRKQRILFSARNKIGWWKLGHYYIAKPRKL